VAAQLHLAKNALALELLLQRLERLVDVVVANENLHLAAISIFCCDAPPIGSPKIIAGAATPPGRGAP
jgi:hypothetical protein